MADSLEERKDQRNRFLRLLYQKTGGDRHADVHMWSLGEELGFTQQQTEIAVQYLDGERLIRHVYLGGGISITHRGVQMVEALPPEQILKYDKHPIVLVDQGNTHGSPEPNEVRSILRTGGKPAPKGTEIKVSAGEFKNTARIRIKLPGAETFCDLGSLPIENGVVTFPMRIVFLCHAREDKPIIKPIADRLRDDAVITWYDDNDLLPGDDWKRRIEQSMNEADNVLVFLSQHSVSKTGFVQREVRYALEQANLRPLGQRYIIPVLLEPCAVPPEFERLHYARAEEPDWYDKLIRALRESP